MKFTKLIRFFVLHLILFALLDSARTMNWWRRLRSFRSEPIAEHHIIKEAKILDRDYGRYHYRRLNNPWILAEVEVNQQLKEEVNRIENRWSQIQGTLRSQEFENLTEEQCGEAVFELRQLLGRYIRILQQLDKEQRARDLQRQDSSST